MRVHLYAICWNESRMLDFFFRHYEPWVDRFVLFDDGSTDGSLDILKSKQRVEVRRFKRSNPDSFELSLKTLHDECWKESRGACDFVVVTDFDEHLYHPALGDYLENCKHRGVSIMPALGFNMVTEEFPDYREHLARTRTLGAPSAYYSKLRIFDPDLIDETDFAIGGHGARPTGKLMLPERDELLLLHYKQLGYDYPLQRNRFLIAGLGPIDLKNNWGFHYFRGNEEQTRLRKELSKILVDIRDPAYLPWRDHPEPRWWRS